MKNQLQVNRGVLAVAVLVCVGFTWRNLAGQQVTPTGESLAAYVIWSGQHSKITRRIYQKITTREQWVKLWYQHIGKKMSFDEFYNPDNVPNINFKSCMVVAVFQGASVNNAGVEPYSVAQQGNLLKVRIVNRFFQTMNQSEKATAYGMFVLPRSDKQVVLEEDIHSTIGDPLLWKERARLK